MHFPTTTIRDLTVQDVKRASAVWVADGSGWYCEVKHNLRLPLMVSASTSAKLSAMPLVVHVDRLTRSSVHAVRQRLRELGFAAGLVADDDPAV